MPDHIIRSLVYVTEEGVAAVRELSARLKSARGKRHVSALLSALVKEASALSGAVEKLGGHVEAVGEVPNSNALDPKRAKEALTAVLLTNALFSNGLCPECAGVLAAPP